MIAVAEALEWAKNFLLGAGLNDPHLESRAILSGLLNISTTHLHLQRDQRLDEKAWYRFQAAVARRSSREPVAYILGHVNFRGHTFQVNPSVLIPRPETELVVEEAIKVIRNEAWKAPRILDVGTGSGCIAVSLAKEIPDSSVAAIDISEGALKVARENAKSNGVDGRLKFYKSDLFESFSGETAFDMILANPPYIASSLLAHLDPELRYEPQNALDGGPDGLAVLTRLIRQAASFLKTTGVLLVEIGFDQGDVVKRLFTTNGFRFVEVWKDDARLDRMVCGWRSHRTAPDRQLLLGV